MTTVGDLKRLLALLPDDSPVQVLDAGPEAPLAVELCARGDRGVPLHRRIANGQMALVAYPGTQDYFEVCNALRHLPPAPDDTYGAFATRRCLRCGHWDDGSRGWLDQASGLRLCDACVEPPMLTHTLPPFPEDLDLEEDAEDPPATERSAAPGDSEEAA